MSKQFPRGWQQRTLASLGEYLNGFAFNDRYWAEEGLPIVRIAQITGSQGIVDRYPGRLPETYRLADGDLIFSWSGTLAVVKWFGGSAWLNQHLFKVVSRNGIDRGFLFHVLSSSVAEMNKRTHGSTMKHIKRGELQEFLVNIPIDEEEQKKITKILDTLDTTLRKTEAIIEKLKQIKQGLLHDLLTRGIDANGELRPPYEQAPHLYKESPLGWIPRDWEMKMLDDIVSAPICYGIVQVRSYIPDGIPVLAIKDLEGDFLTDINRTTISIDAEYKRSRVQSGDVLISIKGTIGRIGVVPDYYSGNISRDIARIRPQGYILSAFLCQLFRSEIGQKILGLSQVGTTRAELSIAPLRDLQFPIPPTKEQERIDSILRKQDQKLYSQVVELKKLRKLKLGLMDDLLTGRVRVTPLLKAHDAPQNPVFPSEAKP